MTPAKTPEERIQAATEYLQRTCQLPMDPVFARSLAKGMLKAADAPSPPKPKWPTDESVSAYCSEFEQQLTDQTDEVVRRNLRAAMLADPIIAAAVAYRDAGLTNISGALFTAGLRLDRAVNEAGL